MFSAAEVERKWMLTHLPSALHHSLRSFVPFRVYAIAPRCNLQHRRTTVPELFNKTATMAHFRARKTFAASFGSGQAA